MKHQPIGRENNAHAISYCPLEALNNASYFAVNSILPLDQERLNSHVLFHFNEHILIYYDGLQSMGPQRVDTAK